VTLDQAGDTSGAGARGAARDTAGASELQLVMASANPHKVTEIQTVLQQLIPCVSVAPRPHFVPDVVEDADTLEGNARLKALALCRATGMAAIADDTGLFVDALDGRPGVRSARFAGEQASDTENVALLLELLHVAGAVQPPARSASFRTVAMVCFPDGSELVGHGRVDGTIATAAVGTNGFGYDAVFVPSGQRGARSVGPADGAPPVLTFAQMTADQKNAQSHRARALADLAHKLGALFHLGALFDLGALGDANADQGSS
jgi:XTP/dITP diphosphohydrolase